MSLSYRTWSVYHCLLPASECLELSTKDLADYVAIAPEREDSYAYLEYASYETDLENREILTQICFLRDAIPFVNTVADQKCYEHCRKECGEKHPNKGDEYRDCMEDCLERERC